MPLYTYTCQQSPTNSFSCKIQSKYKNVTQMRITEEESFEEIKMNSSGSGSPFSMLRFSQNLKGSRNLERQIAQTCKNYNNKQDINNSLSKIGASVKTVHIEA
mmetsp:Transcript_41497/g.30504  ORF Transcript_41497/g.30504 Transcript_41497/m.30504 type:complete len:103 (+) Transcript_41497:224-532(+)